ncbi:MAG: preprotein translocase subunit SecG [Pseudomonadota bacterium]
MIAIILTIHTMIVLALVGVVLLQRSEGGALGMGGGGGGLMSGRGAATALTRTTTVLAALFFTSSLLLALAADRGEGTADFLPTQDEELEEDDFSDILGAPSDDAAPQSSSDAFSLPDSLGIETAPTAVPESESPAADDATAETNKDLGPVPTPKPDEE